MRIKPFEAIVISGAAAAGFLIVIAMTTNSGVGFSPDSVIYTSTAESLRQGRGLVDASSSPFLLPPGYPLLLAGLNSLGFGLKTAARIVNAGALALLGGVSTAWLLRRLKSRWLALGATVAILLSVALLRVVEFAWTETLFAALAVVCVVACEAFVSRQRTRWLLLGAVAAALGTYTRYAGIAFVAAGALVIWFGATSASRKRLRNVSIFVGLGAGPIILWWIRNSVPYSSATGGRAAATTSFSENVGRLFRTVGGWFIPLRLPTLALAIVLAFILVWLVIDSRYVRRRSSNVAFVPFTFAFTYFIFILGAAFVTQIDPLDHRLLSPAFTPLAMSLFAATDGLRAEGPVVRRRATVGTLIALLLLGRSGLFGARYVPRAAANLPPSGYHTLAEEPSPIISWTLDYRPPWKVFTNDPIRLYGVAHMRSSFAPLRDDPSSMRRLRAAVAKEEVFLVWFKKDFRPTVGLDRLKKEFQMKTLTTHPDGAAYLVSPLKK